MIEFQKQLLSQDGNWVAAFWFEILCDIKAPNAGLFDKSGAMTEFGEQYTDAFRN